MIVSVTVLGSKASATGTSASQIVDYLQGSTMEVSNSRSKAGSAPTPVSALGDGIVAAAGVGSYYADSIEEPGRWRGSGASVDGFDLGQSVDPNAFRDLLLGRDPHSGRQLVSAVGSAGRSYSGPANRRPDAAKLPDWLTVHQVAELAGVDASYVRRVAARTAKHREAETRSVGSRAQDPPDSTAFLDAEKDARGHWMIARAEAERFALARDEPQVVMGYDVTWSVPKSVSAFYAQGTTDDRVAIDEAVESAVAAGMGYLERNGFHVRRNETRETGSGMVAASYRHWTNRALEPQIHEHVVVLNIARNSRGEIRTVDARGLFTHATTAGYLAAAHLRTELTQRLGVAWADVRKGVADIDGIDRRVIDSISSRRRAVMTLAQEMGYLTPGARQKAALATRPGKEHPVDEEALNAKWRQILCDVGLDAKAVDTLRNRDPSLLWSPKGKEILFTHLSGRRGVTEQAATFDRREVLQAIASHSNNRLTATEIEDLTDEWLRTEAVVPLNIGDGTRTMSGARTRWGDPARGERRYTTPEMVRLEERTLARHANGVATGHAVVGSSAVESAINRSPVTLGADQASMVRSICTSGDQFQAVVGRAGAGKTTALRAAASAWHEAGFHVVGAAPFAEAARNLEREAGLASSTLEGLLTRIETSGDPASVIDARTVIVVDEASTIGNRQLDRLYRYASETGASVRTIGDPLQHQSVEAGGLWKHIVAVHADRTPLLGANRRQIGPGMAEVRLALDEYRNGLIASALGRLDADSRIVTASNWEELLDTMAADWFVDHQRHLDGKIEDSRMIAERNSDRHALNDRAQALLLQAGIISDPVAIGDVRFHVGDRVVAQARDTDLRPAEADRRSHIVNGSQGTVTRIAGRRSNPDLIVDFDGLGTIRIPHDFIANEAGPGRGGGLAPAYAITSYKAEGQTYDTGRNLAAPGAVNTEGMYVALTRGRNDQRTYTIAPNDQTTEDPELPTLRDERTAIQAVTESLTKRRPDDLATVTDPEVGARLRTLAAQRDHPEYALPTVANLAAAAISDPDPTTVAALGPRPRAGDHRQKWDAAVSGAAIYRARWNTNEVTLDGGVTAPTPSDPAARWTDFDEVRRLVEAAKHEHLTQVPLGQLLRSRHASTLALANDGTSPTGVEFLQHAVEAAERDLIATTSAHATARARHEAAKSKRRNVDPNLIERSRRELLSATNTTAGAQRELTLAKARLEVATGQPGNRAKLKSEVEAIDKALDSRIRNAVKRPATYLTDSLGPRPRTTPQSRRWDKAATSIETYRHHHLGMSPDHGAVARNGIEQAIGPAPAESPIKLRFWKQTRRHIDEHLTRSAERAPALQRTR